jgi:aspartate-semialdehyde dehydrogenase
MSKIRVGILGATGMVGQHFVRLLQNHPWFEMAALAASGRSEGKPYREACRWVISPDMPAAVREMQLESCEPNLECDLVFSALPSDVAGPIEEAFAAAGYWVSSNASSHRMDADVPLLIPEVNPDHICIITHQRRQRGWKRGFIVTNPNCCAVPLAMALKPLADRFGVSKVSVVTLQALSGAGYPGVPSLDILDNVIPYIGGEESKVESEPRKLLGTLEGEAFRMADFAVSAQCNRVAVRDGHFEAVSVALKKSNVVVEDIVETLSSFRALPQELELPSAPQRPLIVRPERDRPQPLYDRDEGNGMSVVVGRVRPCPVLDFKFMVLGHNTIRGAAGAAVLNAELLKAKGYLDLSESRD